MQRDLYASINEIELAANSSKFQRLKRNPWKYFFAISYRIFWYKLTLKSIKIASKTSWGDTMLLNLPAGTDIFLTGGKSDESEIRLSKFIVSYLEEGGTFIDVGSHFGFYSLLASRCVCETGNVISIEASLESFKILKINTESYKNIKPISFVVGAEERDISFFEFPPLYSEYNTIFPEQFHNTSWFKKVKCTKRIIKMQTLDKLIEDEKIKPSMIKIDAEGSEFEIIKGLTNSLKKQMIPFICMEYLAAKRNNLNHVKAVAIMKSLGYNLKVINNNGNIENCDDIEEYLNKKNIDSDNIVFSLKEWFLKGLSSLRGYSKIKILHLLDAGFFISILRKY